MKDTRFRATKPAVAVATALWGAVGLAIACAILPLAAAAQDGQATAAPPPSNGGFVPLSEVHAGMRATAWTVFTGTKPEPMDVEILGVLRGARGPGHDMILAQLHGTKPEYTGVVAGMSGSPVYVGNRLMGSLSYRIGQFSKDAIAGITPIEQMLEVRDIPLADGQAGVETAGLNRNSAPGVPEMNFTPIETPLVMSGFAPDAIRLWQQKMAGTGMDVVMAGGMGASNGSASAQSILPGSAVSAELVRGDLEIAATCTVTYVDPKQLLACGHPVLQAGQVSLPMTTAEVVATLASPLNAFKIVNTGATIGAFTEDRDSAIRGVFGAQARMIPMHIAVHSPAGDKKLNIEVLDLPSLTAQAVLVSLYQALLNTNESTADTSYHVTGSIAVEGYAASPVDLWSPAGDMMPPAMMAGLLTAERFSRIYSNGSRQGVIRSVNLEVEAIPRRVQVDLETARLVANGAVHAGDTVTVEATIRPWRQPSRNVRVKVKLPSRLNPGNLRLLISDAGTLDRTMDQPKASARPTDIQTVLAQARKQHPADQLYLSLLVPETQAGMAGQTLSSLPLSVANALEPLRSAQDVVLNGESAEVLGWAPAGGVLNGFQVLSLRVDPGSGIN